MKKRILVFPCGSEIGLEIYRSLQYSLHFTAVGASSVDDHGRFVFAEYIGGLPFHDHPDFIEQLGRVVREQQIDGLFPATDAVTATLHRHAARLGCKIIGHDARVADICASKTATAQLLAGVIPQARRYAEVSAVAQWPIFIKPDRGYGSRHCLCAADAAAANAFLRARDPQDYLLLEYLPGREWTIDCFSDRHGRLRFSAARQRRRISNGISVNTVPDESHTQRFADYAARINERLRPRGAWFFQMKEDRQEQLTLLEVAARLGGSSGLFRMKGVNFALLTLFDAFDHEVSVEENDYALEMDRALVSRVHIRYAFSDLYVDLDDCLIVDGRVNAGLLAFIYQQIGDGKRVHLVTRHRGDLSATLQRYRLNAAFDQVFHLRAGEPKSSVIAAASAIFIDDSFAERREVAATCGIPVFAPEMLNGTSFSDQLFISGEVE